MTGLDPSLLCCMIACLLSTGLATAAADGEAGWAPRWAAVGAPNWAEEILVAPDGAMWVRPGSLRVAWRLEREEGKPAVGEPWGEAEELKWLGAPCSALGLFWRDEPDVGVTVFADLHGRPTGLLWTFCRAAISAEDGFRGKLVLDVGAAGALPGDASARAEHRPEPGAVLLNGTIALTYHGARAALREPAELDAVGLTARLEFPVELAAGESVAIRCAAPVREVAWSRAADVPELDEDSFDQRFAEVRTRWSERLGESRIEVADERIGECFRASAGLLALAADDGLLQAEIGPTRAIRAADAGPIVAALAAAGLHEVSEATVRRFVRGQDRDTGRFPAAVGPGAEATVAEPEDQRGLLAGLLFDAQAAGQLRLVAALYPALLLGYAGTAAAPDGPSAEARDSLEAMWRRALRGELGAIAAVLEREDDLELLDSPNVDGDPEHVALPDLARLMSMADEGVSVWPAMTPGPLSRGEAPVAAARDADRQGTAASLLRRAHLLQRLPGGRPGRLLGQALAVQGLPSLGLWCDVEGRPDVRAAAEYVLLIRDMLACHGVPEPSLAEQVQGRRERERRGRRLWRPGAIYLFGGAPWEWLAEDGPVAVTRLPTAFGPVTFRMHRRGRRAIEVLWQGAENARVDSVTVCLPREARALSAISDGRTVPRERVRPGQVAVLGTMRRLRVEVER